MLLRWWHLVFMPHLGQHATPSSDGKLSSASNRVPLLQTSSHACAHMQEHQNLTFGQAQSVDAHLDVQHAHGSMQHPKSQEAAKVLRHEHSVEAHDRDAGRLNGAQDDEGGISHIQLAVHATQEDARQAVNGQQVNDE